MRVGVEHLGAGGTQALHLGQERRERVGVEREAFTGPHDIRWPPPRVTGHP